MACPWWPQDLVEDASEARNEAVVSHQGAGRMVVPPYRLELDGFGGPPWKETPINHHKNTSRNHRCRSVVFFAPGCDTVDVSLGFSHV